jgi:uncharacterized protein YdeI (YjbR/CyaY-like superfamily)
MDGEEALAFEDAAQWASWLAGHHDQVDSAWLRIAKKGSGKASLTIREALDVALCYGWIDSQRRAYDESYYLQRYSRRRSSSSWSRVNVDRVEELIAAGRMRAPGLAEVSAAKADGRWDGAYQSQRTATVPPDLGAALAENAQAASAFEALGKTERYAVILQLLKARTPEVRAARLQKAIATLATAAEA